MPVGGGVPLLPVRQHLVERGLVGDDQVDQVGALLSESQGGDRTSAGAEHGGRAGVEMNQQPRQVVGPQLRGGVLVGAGHRAAVDPARVGGQHPVVRRQQLGQRCERSGVHRRTDQRDERALAAHLVVQAGAGNLERGDGWCRNGGVDHLVSPGGLGTRLSSTQDSRAVLDGLVCFLGGRG